MSIEKQFSFPSLGGNLVLFDVEVFFFQDDHSPVDSPLQINDRLLFFLLQDTGNVRMRMDQNLGSLPGNGRLSFQIAENLVADGSLCL